MGDKMKTPNQCSPCEGTGLGQEFEEKCPECNGTGAHLNPVVHGGTEHGVKWQRIVPYTLWDEMKEKLGITGPISLLKLEFVRQKATEGGIWLQKAGEDEDGVPYWLLQLTEDQLAVLQSGSGSPLSGWIPKREHSGPAHRSGWKFTSLEEDEAKSKEFFQNNYVYLANPNRPEMAEVVVHTNMHEERFRVGDIITFGLGGEFEVTKVDPDDFSEDPCTTLVWSKCIKVGEMQGTELGENDLTREEKRELVRRPTK